MSRAIHLNSQVGRVRADKQEKILRAAEKEFEQHGYGGARMQRIADIAGIPKANIHYYYKNKLALYQAVLNGVLSLWNSAFDDIRVEDDPAESIERYIRAKLDYSRRNTRAARIFASEVIHGAPHLKEQLRKTSQQWIEDKSKIIERWIELGKMKPIDPFHLFFLIWGATQHYADYHAQVALIYDKEELDDSDYNAIAESITQIILSGCGLK